LMPLVDSEAAAAAAADSLARLAGGTPG
jgi:hypothetical protein